MVISLYICEIPRNVDKSDLEDLFKSMDGYLDSRVKPTNDMRKIAFVDFREEKQAIFALETLQGFKFSPEDKGLIIKISDNTKGGITQPKYKNNKRRRNSSTEARGRKRRSRSRSRSYSGESDKLSERRREESYTKVEKADKEKSLPQGQTNPPLLDLISLLSASTNKPYTLDNLAQTTQNSLTSGSDPNMFSNLLECLQNLQTVQLISSIAQPAPEKEPSRKVPSHFEQTFSRYDDFFRHPVDIRKHATNIVYLEGLPNDSSEREVAHIFRPFPGFKSVRLITREKNGQKSLICFADFEEVSQSTLCINTLQGYRFDKNDLVGLHFSYGVSKNKDRK
jgi:RNA recognition motif-containing protein